MDRGCQLQGWRLVKAASFTLEAVIVITVVIVVIVVGIIIVSLFLLSAWSFSSLSL